MMGDVALYVGGEFYLPSNSNFLEIIAFVCLCRVAVTIVFLKKLCYECSTQQTGWFFLVSCTATGIYCITSSLFVAMYLQTVWIVMGTLCKLLYWFDFALVIIVMISSLTMFIKTMTALKSVIPKVSLLSNYVVIASSFVVINFIIIWLFSNKYNSAQDHKVFTLFQAFFIAFYCAKVTASMGIDLVTKPANLDRDCTQNQYLSYMIRFSMLLCSLQTLVNTTVFGRSFTPSNCPPTYLMSVFIFSTVYPLVIYGMVNLHTKVDRYKEFSIQIWCQQLFVKMFSFNLFTKRSKQMFDWVLKKSCIILFVWCVFPICRWSPPEVFWKRYFVQNL